MGGIYRPLHHRVRNHVVDLHRRTDWLYFVGHASSQARRRGQSATRMYAIDEDDDVLFVASMRLRGFSSPATTPARMSGRSI
eukprot:scaffold319280_cov34-Prasinocladus_malaysianus.AAC.1